MLSIIVMFAISAGILPGLEGLSAAGTIFGDDKMSANLDENVAHYSNRYTSTITEDSVLSGQPADWLQHIEVAVRDAVTGSYMQFDSDEHVAYADDTVLSRPFITTWHIFNTTESITIPVDGATGEYTIDWGDGTVETVTGDVSHLYAASGTYTVSISGDFTRIHLGSNFANAQKLQSVEQWGNIQWSSMNDAFAGASNMVYNATDAPILSNVNDMSGMFSDASSFNGNISSWDVSDVTDMYYMFRGASSFNGDISGWDVSGVTDMSTMFRGASSFNADISGWDVSGVTDMSGMFRGASSFTSDLSSWDVSGVTDMRFMFYGASSFTSDLSSWDVSGVTDMSGMFSSASSFTSDLSSWDVSGVTDMDSTFGKASSFTSDLSSWDVSGVTDMRFMFYGASSFTSDLSSWNVSGVTDMRSMFSGAFSFNSNISEWDVSAVTGMSYMFDHVSSFTSDLSSWNVSAVTDMGAMFRGASSFNADISGWDVSGVTDMQDMFHSADAFDQNLGKWYIVLDDHSIDDGDQSRIVASLSAQNSILAGQSSYSISSDDDGDTFEIVGSDLKLKSVPNHATKSSYTVTILSGGGFGTTNSETFDISVDPVILPHTTFVTTWTTTVANESIKIPVGGAAGQYTVDWGDGNQETVTGDALHQYSDAGTYTVSISGDFTRINLGGDSANAQKLQSIEQWGDIQWSSMNDAFAGASNMVYNATDAPVLSGVNDMNGMFHLTSSFDGDISSWNVSGVTDMRDMFSRASSFNADISGWDVSGVTDMSGMFRGASSFTSDLSSWDVSGVTDMRFMFYGASSFTSDLSSWDVSGVTDMSGMFSSASSFTSDLSSWDVSGVTDMDSTFGKASSFTSDLSSWDVSGVTDMRFMFYGASSFTSDLSSWNVSGVTDMRSMFSGAFSFNSNISEWDVSAVTGMSYMFDHVSSFTSDLSSWNVSAVTDMGAMFRGASSFNADISGWDVSGVTDMQDMFHSADAFDQNLGKWYIVLDDHSIDDGDQSRIVASLSAQNSILAGQSSYSISSDDDGDTFEIVGSDLKLKSVPNHATKSSYTVTILSGGGFGTTNSETFDISVDPVILPHTTFVTTWTTTVANESIKIPVGGAAGQYTVDWGDGNQETVTGDALHQYSDARTYTVSISGDFTRINLGGDSANAQKL